MLPPLSSREEIHRRLQSIFPPGLEHRGYCTRELAASTVFAALYIGAIDGAGVYFGPKHVYRMTTIQARKLDERSRANYAKSIRKGGYQPRGKRWYSDNTREPIRDETLRDGLIAVGGVTEKPNVPTTSGVPRYALTTSFAGLFDPSLPDVTFRVKAEQWQSTCLSKKALARIALVRSGAAANGETIVVSLPNGEVKRLTHEARLAACPRPAICQRADVAFRRTVRPLRRTFNPYTHKARMSGGRPEGGPRGPAG